MEQNNKSSSRAGLVIAAIVVVIGVGVAAFALTNNTNKDSDNDNTKTTAKSKTSNSDGGSQATDKAVVGSTVIKFTDKGFDKSSYNSKAGEAVTVKNESSMDLQFSSNDHPTHLANPELNMSVMGPGESGTFTPPGAGTYGFHDHINDEFTGTLIVE